MSHIAGGCAGGSVAQRSWGSANAGGFRAGPQRRFGARLLTGAAGAEPRTPGRCRGSRERGPRRRRRHDAGWACRPAGTPLSSRRPTSRGRCATADRPGPAHESPPAVGRAASGTRAGRPARLGATEHPVIRTSCIQSLSSGHPSLLEPLCVALSGDGSDSMAGGLGSAAQATLCSRRPQLRFALCNAWSRALLTNLPDPGAVPVEMPSCWFLYPGEPWQMS